MGVLLNHKDCKKKRENPLISTEEVLPYVHEWSGVTTTTTGTTTISMFRDTSRLEISQWTDRERWSFITNNALRMFSAGMLFAGAAGFVLFRSVTARAATIAFGAGCGVGNAYVDAKYILGHNLVPSSTAEQAQVRIAEVVEMANPVEIKKQ